MVITKVVDLEKIPLLPREIIILFPGCIVQQEVKIFPKANKLGIQRSTVRLCRCGAILENRPARQNGLEKAGVIPGVIPDPGARIRFYLNKEFRAAGIRFYLHKPLVVQDNIFCMGRC